MSGDRPSGTVTFLFTDIEGSTKRWEADPDAMGVELAAHDDVLHSAIESHGGWLFKHTGDGVCAAFVSARGAIDAQRGLGLLAAGDPHREVWFAWNAKEVVRQLYDHTDPGLAAEWIDAIGRDFTDPEMPLEVRRLGRTIRRWRDQIVAWHQAHVSNGPTEAVNNLAKRVKRAAFGFRRYDHYRIRVLHYAGQPNRELLDTITPR